MKGGACQEHMRLLVPTQITRHTYLCRAKSAHTTVATDESLLISFHLLQLIFQTLFGTISVSLAPMHAIIHVTVCAICCG